MFDYYTKVHSMNEEKLVEEMQKLHKKIASINPQSPIYDQLLNMVQTAESAYYEKLTVNRIKNKSTASIIEIGTIAEQVYVPDYSAEELLLAVVSLYTNNNPENKS